MSHRLMSLMVAYFSLVPFALAGDVDCAGPLHEPGKGPDVTLPTQLGVNGLSQARGATWCEKEAIVVAVAQFKIDLNHDGDGRAFPQPTIQVMPPIYHFAVLVSANNSALPLSATYTVTFDAQCKIIDGPRMLGEPAW